MEEPYPGLFMKRKGGKRDNTMGKIIVKDAVARKPGFLYYVDGQGNVCEAKMARSGKKNYSVVCQLI